VLEAAETAVRPIEMGEARLAPENVNLLRVAADLLRTVSSGLVSGNKVTTSTPQYKSFLTALDGVVAHGGADRVIPIADLFYNDAGPHIVMVAPNPPTTPAQRFRMEVVSLGEHLHRVIDESRRATDAIQQEHAKGQLGRALRAIRATASSFGQMAVAQTVDGHLERTGDLNAAALDAISSFAATISPPPANLPPAPPAGLTAVAKHGKVILNWTPSPTPNVVAVTLAYGPTAGPLGAPANLGNVTTITIAGLTNGVEYTFVLRALDSDGDLSAPVSIVATPVQLITVGGIGFNTLEGAAAAAARNQTILVGEDTFLLQQPLVLGSGVSLAGVNAHVTRIEAAGPFVMVAASGHQSISMVTLANGSIGVDIDGAGTIVRNCVIRGMSDAGISVHGRAEIVNNTIVRNAVAGVRSLGSSEARNNIVQDNGVGFSGHVASTYNDVSDGFGGVLPGTGDVHAPVLFLDEATGDYREAALQASLDAGDRRDDYANEPSPNGGRINMGAFGNTALAAPSPSATTSGGGGSCGASVSVLPVDGFGLTALLGLLLLLVLGRPRVLDLGRWNSRVDRS